MKIAIIPARGNSKRIKNKNIKNFLGKPIIEITYRKLKSFKIFDKIILNTESKKIINKTKYLNFDLIIRRKKKLSNDNISTADVINDTIKILNKKYNKIESVTCVYPCNPFLKKKNLVDGFKKIKNKKDFVFPIQEFPTPIERSIVKKGKSYFYNNKKNMKKMSQEFDKKFYDCGQFYIGSTTAWKAREKNFKCIILPKFSTVDINDIEDWSFSEKLFKIIK